MSVKINAIETAKAVIVRSEEGHIVIRIKDRQDLEVDDMREINEAKYKLVGEEKHTVIFIPGENGTLSNEAREYSARPEVNRNALAKGIVAKNLADRMIGNFFIRFNRPPAPTKMFPTEKQASDWLTKMKNQEN